MNEPLTAEQNELLLENLPSVQNVVNGMRAGLPPCVDREDLVSAGTDGLIAAVRAADPSKMQAFRGYACMRVRGAILDHLRNTDFTSRRDRTRIRTFRAARDELEQKYQRELTDEEVAAELGLSNADLVRYQRAEALQIISIETPAGDSGKPFDYKDENAATGRQILEEKETRDSLLRCVETLPERLKHVLSLYYFHAWKLGEIAESMGVTESRASQLMQSAIYLLRCKLGRGVDALLPS